MAIFKKNKNKIKNGGTGTKVGNTLRALGSTVSSTIQSPSVQRAANVLSKTISPTLGTAITRGGRVLGASTSNVQNAPSGGRTMIPGPQYGPSLDGGMSLIPKEPLMTMDPSRAKTGKPSTDTNTADGGFNMSVIPGTSITRTSKSGPTSSTPTTSAMRVSSVGSTYGGSSTPGTSTGTGAINAPYGASVIGEDFDYEKTPQQIAEEEAYRRAQEYADQQSRQDVNPENTYQDALRQFQGEIDAVNQVYAERLRQAALEGKSRLGSTRAENFNAGATQSSFGAAATERAMQENRAVEAGVMAEKLQALGQIEAQARELGNKYYQDKKAAKEAGIENYITAIKNSGAVKESITADIVTSILNKGLDISEISEKSLEKIAKNAGVSVRSIINTYNKIKDEMAAAEAEAALKGQFNLSEGQARYDAQGNLIASRAKTYAPSSGGSGSGSYGGQLSALAIAVRNGTISLDKLTPTERGRVAAELSAAGVPSGRQETLTANLDVVNSLLNNPNRKQISGFIQGKLRAGNLYPGAQLALNQYNQLKGILSLENREKLKGSGAISDFEFKVLSDAATALGRNLSDKQFEDQLIKIADVFEGKYAMTNGVAQDTSLPEEQGGEVYTLNGVEYVQGPDGQYYPAN